MKLKTLASICTASLLWPVLVLGAGAGSALQSAYTRNAGLTGYGNPINALQLSLGNGKFSPGLPSPPVQAPAVEVIRALTPSNNNPIFLQPPSYSSGGQYALDVALGDLNNDGRVDTVIANATSVGVLLSNGDGTFQPVHTYASGGQFAYSVVIADVNKDGKLDLVVANECQAVGDCSVGNVSILLGNGDGTFAPAQSFGSGGSFTYSVAVGDFNGDNKFDLAVANACQTSACLNGSVTILLGNGDGTFQTAVSYASGGLTASSLVTADFDGDGKVDIAVVNHCTLSTCGNGNVGILLGNGNGTFQAVQAYASGGYTAISIAVLDVNKDNKRDIVIANQCLSAGNCDSGSVGVLLNAGNGTFQAALSYASGGGNATSVAIADVNGDGNMDVIASNQTGGGVGVLLGNGNGTFRPAQSYVSGGQTALAVAAYDFNGDAKLDLVVANHCQPGDCSSGAAAVLLGNGDGTFQTPKGYASNGVFATSVATADLNGDNKADLVMANPCQVAACNSGSVSVLTGNGDGTFQTSRNYPSGGAYASALAIADVNADGKLDLVVANKCKPTDCSTSDISVLFGNGDGTFQPAQSYALTGYQPVSVVVGDVNGDGRPDLVVANYCQSSSACTNGVINLLLGNGNGTFQPAQNFPAGGEYTALVAIADLNRDGKPDLIVANGCQSSSNCSAGVASVLIGNGDGTFQSAVNYSSGGAFANWVAVSDLNGDGKQDVIVANSCTPGVCTTGNVGVLVGNGDGTLQAAQSYSSGGQTAYALLAGDFDGDGRTDLIVTNAGSTGVLLGNGDATFQAATAYSPGGRSVAAADFNLDTKLDVALIDASSDIATVLLNIATVSQQQGTTTTLNSSLNPSVFNQSVTFTATVAPLVSGNPTGTVTFNDGSTPLGTITLTNGTAALTTSTLLAGTHSVTAVYSGDSNFFGSTSAPVIQVVSQATTTVALTSNLNPSVFNQSVTLTATITPQFGGQASGNINFLDGATSIGTSPISNNIATLTTSTLAAGTHSITAVYSGDSNFTGSTSSALSQVVNQATTTTTLTSSPNPSTVNQSVLFTATVAGQFGGAPSGTVTLMFGSKNLGKGALSNGQMSISVTFGTAGTRTIAAVYSGDANFITSTSATVSQVVNKVPTTTLVTSSQNPSSFNQSVTFTATVSSTAGNPPDGETVNFKDGGTIVGSGTLASGLATFSTSTLTVGGHRIQAVYAGDAQFNGSTSSALTQTVTKSVSTVALASSQNPSSFGQSVTFTATVTGQNGGTPTGTITFKDGPNTLAVVNLAGGAAGYTTSALSQGQHNIISNYSGDANFKNSTASLVQTVN